MKTYLGYPIYASLLMFVVGCGSDDNAKPEGSSTTSGAEADESFASCKKQLKTCNYDESETACSSLKTAVIPLTSGATWGDIELEQGPYGSYVEWNEGADFKTPVSPLESTCAIAASLFGEPASVTADVLDLRGQDLGLYTVFRPACMKDGETYPVITWGNGTCGQSGGYASLLATVASHGFVVIASNSRWTDGGNMEMLKALDFAKAANEDESSVLYQKLNLDKIGAMGHSQGAGATANAAKDPRIKALILWNGALTSPEKPFLSVSGERDTAPNTPVSMAAAVGAAPKPGAWLFYHKVLETGGSVTGHLTLMEQAERVTEPTVAWWKYMLNDDPEAKKMFVGANCGLCSSKDEFEYGAHDLP